MNRMKPNERRDVILAAALSLASTVGYDRMTRADVADRAQVATGLVSHYFKNMKGLRVAVITAAVEQRDLTVVAQALVAKHPLAHAAPKSLRRKASRSIC